MVSVKINDLTGASSVTDSMQFEVDIGGSVSQKVTATQIKTYVGGRTSVAASGSTNGLGILVAATSGTGTLIHTATSDQKDSVVLYAFNNHTSSVDLTLQIGGTASGNLRVITLPAKNGPYPIYHGIPLTGSTVVGAIASVANVVVIDALINRVPNDSGFPSGSTNGLGILVSATTGEGTLIHTVPTSSNHAVTLYATNNSSSPVTLTLQVGGTSAQHLRIATIPVKTGSHPVFVNGILTGETTIRAITSETNTVVIDAIVDVL